MNPASSTSATSIADQIREAAKRGELALPTLPEVVTKLINLLRDDEADARVIADLLQTDSAMTAALLRMANSVSFAGLRPIGDTEGAIARIGFRQIGTLVTAAAHRANYVSHDPERMEMLHVLWNEALASALSARRLAIAAHDDAGESYLAGLLHDTGKLLVLRGVELIERRLDTRYTRRVIDELMDLLHTELGHGVLFAWRIPEPVCQVTLNHHQPLDGRAEPLLVRLQAADAVARKLCGGQPHDRELELLDVPAIARLGLSDLEVATLLVDVEDELMELKKML